MSVPGKEAAPTAATAAHPAQQVPELFAEAAQSKKSA